MDPVWIQRREEVLRDCLVSPDVFHQMVERLAECVVPYQHVLETEAGQRHVHLYLQGLLSHLPGKNAEDIARQLLRNESARFYHHRTRKCIPPRKLRREIP